MAHLLQVVPAMDAVAKSSPNPRSLTDKQLQFALFVREFAVPLGSRPGPGRPSTLPTPPEELVRWLQRALLVPDALLPADLPAAADEFVCGRQPHVLPEEWSDWLRAAYGFAFPNHQ